jgi:glutamyl-tRNA synthetase
MILGDDGQKLSIRLGAVSVMQYDDDGYLPAAVLNYLARLGWSHGDDEVFDMAQFTQWFDLDHITPSAAQFNTEKLNWLNAHYLKQTDDAELAALVRTRLEKRGVTVSDTPDLTRVVALYKGRVSNLNQLADEAEVFYLDLHPAQELLDTHITPDVLPALRELAAGFAEVEWQASAIAALIKQVLANHTLKMPKLAMPVRVMLVGQTHTPSVDAVISLFAREVVLARMARCVK